jgi:large subunit ribosomal protein L37Ae
LRSLMARRTQQVGVVGRFGPRYGVRIRRRVQEIDEGRRARHVCPKCQAPAVRRRSSGVWQCHHCGHVFAGGAYRPVITTSFKRELAATAPAEETKDTKDAKAAAEAKLPKEPSKPGKDRKAKPEGA